MTRLRTGELVIPVSLIEQYGIARAIEIAKTRAAYTLKMTPWYDGRVILPLLKGREA